MKILKAAVLLCVIAIAGCSKMPDEMFLKKAAQYETGSEWDKAIANYEKLARLYPKSTYRAEALYKAGLVYANGKQAFPQAISTLEQVIKEYENDPIAAQSQFMIGFIQANMASDTANARVSYNRFLEKYPDHELAESVRWELKYLGRDINEIKELQFLGEEPGKTQSK